MTDDYKAAVDALTCCAKPSIGSAWAYGVSGPQDQPPDRVILRISGIHCEACGTEYALDEDEPVEQVQRDSLALRIRPVRRKPS